MNNEILQVIKETGLSDNEAKVYLKLLELGRAKASQLINELGMARGVIYFLLDQLESKGLITKIPKGKRFLYQPQYPSELLRFADMKIQKIKSSKARLESFLPMLMQTYSENTVKPVVSYYDGLEGIKKVYNDTLIEKKTIYAAMQSGPVHQDVHNWLRNEYVIERVRLGIRALVIMAKGERIETFIKENKAKLREMVVIDKDLFPIKMEVNIYGNKVAFISSHADSDKFGVIIDSPFVSQTMLALWRLAWIGAGGSLPDSGDI